jgi:hypothetical protein
VFLWYTVLGELLSTHSDLSSSTPVTRMCKSQSRFLGCMVIRVLILALAIALGNVHARIGIGLVQLVGSVVRGGIVIVLSSVLPFKILCGRSVLRLTIDHTAGS